MKNLLFLSSLLLLLSLSANSQTKQKAESSSNAYFKALKYRNIGPFRGGRSVTASGVIGDPLTYYMGTTGGGLWKTEDAGQHWNNISDGFFKTGSVGAIAVSPSDPNILYCGMGEHAVRGVMTHHGDGMYKSLDAGKTWKKIALDASQHIARIVIHPQNPNLVYVAVQGALYGPSETRGIYRSQDGGKNWEKVLYVNPLSGGVELSMDAHNPHILYAALWEHQRKPWKVISGGEGSGLYKSSDGGDTWEKIQKGLPKELGKMAVSVSPANSNKVYALVESDSQKEKGGLFVSNNAGESWTRVSKDHRLIQRAWYYTEVFTDPNDENTVYVLSAPALRSIDGGKTWERLSGTHGDYHDLWINPNNSKNMVIANDGGAAISFNYGKTWSTQSNMPTAQFYRVNVDNQFPYSIYGGQQDNSSIKISHRELGSRGISEKSWSASAGGESAFLAFDPDDPRYVLGGSYLGTIEILDTKAKSGTKIMAAPIQYLGEAARDMKYRFNWNAPIIWSQHEPNTYYHGAQILLRTQDRGKTWEEVSPDLSRNDSTKQGKGGGPYTVEAVGAENYGTISYLLESPHTKGHIWVGTDDGVLSFTPDGGKTWEKRSPAGLGECLINAIEISPQEPQTIYIATTRYKFNDHRPGLYKSTDYGKTWRSINQGIPENAFTRVIREDEKRKDLLFAGTELGMFISWNGGQNWEAFQLNLPVCPITDLAIRHGDLIVATSGRSFWILDDLGLLNQYQKSSEGALLYAPESTYLTSSGSELNQSKASFKGSHPLRGVNPASGVVIYYHLDSLAKNQVIHLEVKDESGSLVRRYSSKKDSTFQSYPGGPPSEAVLSKSKGLNRFVWDMHYPTMPGIPKAYIEGNYRGHRASPGKYRVSLKIGEKTLEQGFEILANPHYSNSPQDYQDYHQIMQEMEGNLTEMHEMTQKLYKAQENLLKIHTQLSAESKHQALCKEIKSRLEEMKKWDEDMVQRKSKAYDDVENFPNKFTANYLFLINHCDSAIPRINQASRERKEALDAQWAELKKEGERLWKVVLPNLNKQLWEAGIGAVWMQD